MTARLATLLLGLSQRERWLLAGLFGLALPVAVVFFWVIPLLDARTKAAAELQEALKLRQWVGARAVDMAALDAPATAQEPERNRVPIGLSGIEESLKAAGLRDAVSRLANREAQGIELRFDRVGFRQLTDWLEATQPRWGYVLQGFRFERSDTPGMVSAEFLLGGGQ